MNQDERLRRAVNKEPVPRDLEARVRTRLDSSSGGARPRRGLSGFGRLLSSLALLVFMLGATQYYGVQKTRDLLRVGLDDHLHCAIEGAYPRQAGKAEAMTALGPYSPMLQPVLDQFPGDSLVSAHRCTVGGRDYVHMILRRDRMLISVILTKRKDGETFPRTIIPVHESGLAGYSISSFGAGGYLGYVVSGLPGQQNDRLAGLVAPVVRRYTGA
jgi:hypothetical protein